MMDGECLPSLCRARLSFLPLSSLCLSSGEVDVEVRPIKLLGHIGQGSSLYGWD